MSDYDTDTSTIDPEAANSDSAAPTPPSVDDIAREIQSGLQRMFDARKIVDEAEAQLAKARAAEEQARAAAKKVVDEAQTEVADAEKGYAEKLEAVLDEGYVTRGVLASQGLDIRKRRGGRGKGSATGQGTSVKV